MVPVLDIVVTGLFTVDQSFNGVTVVVQHEDVWSQTPSDHGGDFLDDSTQKSTDGVTDGTPQDLGDTHGVVWELSLDDTEGRGTGFGDDDIAFSEPGTNSGPQPFLGQWGLWVGWGVQQLWLRNWLWNVGLDHWSDDLVQFLQDVLEVDAWESGVSDLDVVRVELDNVLGLVGVREGPGVEVRQQGTDGENQVGAFDSLLDGWLRQSTDIDTTESWVLLVDSTLTHRSGEGWELGDLDQLSGFLLDVVTSSTGIDQDNWVRGVLDQVQDGFDDFGFGLWVVFLQGQVDWGVQERSWDVLVNQVCCWGGLRVLDESSGVGDVGGHSVEDSEVTVTQGVVQQQLLGLGGDRWDTDNV
ncbi:hypothetical protein WICPIJ_000936 [Wickerhamomyces pijperi]|uniref:Uncharacterized protein n=1 Tax=Wickerhamomyces pijperi TaxID=599730 RepID=A0A9P8QF03_WICPI|nr:hypothetical protein WICPIJ_000936 [Wickerhamomyces pijperi]